MSDFGGEPRGTAVAVSLNITSIAEGDSPLVSNDDVHIDRGMSAIGDGKWDSCLLSAEGDEQGENPVLSVSRERPRLSRVYARRRRVSRHGCDALIFEGNARVLQTGSERSEGGGQKMLDLERGGVKDLYSRPAAGTGAFRWLSVAHRSAHKPDCAPLQVRRLLKA